MCVRTCSKHSITLLSSDQTHNNIVGSGGKVHLPGRLALPPQYTKANVTFMRADTNVCVSRHVTIFRNREPPHLNCCEIQKLRTGSSFSSWRWKLGVTTDDGQEEVEIELSSVNMVR